jgi:hypothetical protein
MLPPYQVENSIPIETLSLLKRLKSKNLPVHFGGLFQIKGRKEKKKHFLRNLSILF